MNFIFESAKQYFTHSLRSYCFCHETIKFISSSRCVMFFLLYRQKDIEKIIEGNYRNYVIDYRLSINSRVRLWKINQSGPGCGFYEFYK